MTYTFTSAEIAEIDLLMQGGGSPPFNYVPRPVSGAYQYILSRISVNQDPDLGPAPDIDPGIWQWFKGAALINRGEGVFSTFIRDYTAAQRLTRLGEATTVSDMNLASDSIGQRVVSSIKSNGNQLITLSDIGRDDAGAIGNNIFQNGLYPTAGWSGNLLFPMLGEDQFFRQNILNSPEGIYSFLVMAKASVEASGSTWTQSTWGELGSGISTLWSLIDFDGGFEGSETIGPEALGAMFDQAKTLFQQFYGSSFDSLLSGVIADGFVLGREDSSDVLSQETFEGIIAAHSKDDQISVTEFGGIIDGGSGNDTLNYNSSSSLYFEIDSSENMLGATTLAPFVGSITFGASLPQSRVAKLYDVETVKLGNGDDRISARSIAHLPNGFTVDGGGGDDTFDASNAVSGLNLDLSATSGLVLKNIESIIGSDFVDVVGGTSAHDNVRGGADDDVLRGEGGDDELGGDGGNDLLDGGAGVDLIEGGFGDDRIIGGKGNDTSAGGVPGGLFGGFGDDLIIAELNDGDDDIDGGLNGIDLPLGDGTDTIVYKYARGDSTVRVIDGAWIRGQFAADFGISITGAQDETGATGSFGNDTLTSIEKASVEAGIGTDTLIIDGKSYFGYLNYVDLGSQGSGYSAYDVLDARSATTNITVDLRNINDQSLTVNDGFFIDSTLSLRNVENVNGTDFDDVIYGTDASTGSQLLGNAGKDELYGGEHADVLVGGSGDDLLVGGGGADNLDGGTGADILVVDALDTIARGDVEDKLYWKSYTENLISSNRLRGGIRTVVVNDSQTQDQQILSMLNSTAAFKGAMGETYEVIGPSTAQGLRISMSSGETINIANWSEGEYGIYLETTKRREISYTPINFGVLGTPTLGFGLGPLLTLVVNGVLFAAELAYDPNWGAFAGDRFTLTQLQGWASQPGQPARSNTLTGTGGNDTINGRIGDDRVKAGAGNDSVDGGLGDDYIDGGDGNDTLSGGFGADQLEGGAGDDVLDGGVGSDTITGGAGKDTLNFRAGDGTDVVVGDTQDIIRFADVASTSVTVSSGSAGAQTPAYGAVSSGNLVLSSGSDKVTIQGANFGSIEFADGVVKNAAVMARSAITAATTSANDTILGFGTADRLAGGTGNDYLNGLGGNDRYFFGIGDGQDRVEDSAGIADKIILGPGITAANVIVSTSQVASGPRAGQTLARLAVSGTSDWIEFVVRDIEEVRFADGTIWNRAAIGSKVYSALGTAGDDSITVQNTINGDFRPGAGNDVIKVGTYANANVLFGRGSGVDRIELSNDGQFAGGRAIVTLDSDLSLGDLSFERSGDGFVIKIVGTTDRLEIVRYYDSAIQSNWRTLDFEIISNGTRFTTAVIESLADIDAGTALRQAGSAFNDVLTGSAGRDVLSGFAGADTLNGGDGSDILFGGAGNDILSGGAERDTIFGENGDDQIDGGAGNDVLYAGTGIDSVIGGLGNDEIFGNGQSILNGGQGDDRVSTKLGDTIIYNLGDGNDTVIQLANSQTFDGSSLVRRTEISLGAGINPTTTTLTLEGWAIYINVNGSTTERVRLDRLFQSDNLPQIRFADGTVWREAEVFDRLFSPNNGNATATGLTSAAPDWNGNLVGYVYGGAGTDTLTDASISASEYRFVFAPGNGTDTVAATGKTGGKVQLYGFDPDQMVLARSGTGMRDFTITFTGSTDTLIIQQQETGGLSSRISEFNINGSRFFASDLRSRWMQQSTTSGDDTITAFDGPGGYQDTGIVSGIQFFPNPGNDTLQGGLGNDTMVGGTGDDTYIVNIGDGSDIVRDVGLFNASVAAGYDILLTNALSTNAVFRRSTTDINDLVVTFTNSSDQILLDQFYTVGTIEEFEFGDGVVLSNIDVEQLAIAASVTVGADSIRGSASPDTINGGAGNDMLNGLGGSDRYLFNLGDGQDTISDSVTTDSNTLAFGAGINPEQVVFQRVGNDLKVTVNANDIVTVTGQFNGAAVRPISQAVFANGTRISAGEIDQQALAQLATSGNDTITGFASNDTVSGGAGNDTLNGGAGNDLLIGGVGNDTLNGQQGADIYQFAAGDGVDTVASTSDTVVSDVVRFTSGITSRDVEFVRPTPTSPNLVINIRGTSQSVTISNYFGGLAVKQFEFSDGIMFAAADVTAALANVAPAASGQTWRMTAFEGTQNRIVLPDNLFSDDMAVSGLTYRATLSDGSPLPAWLQFDGRIFEANGQDIDVGTYTVRLTAVDRFGASANRLVKLDLLNSNDIPVVGSSIATQTAMLGQAFNYTLPAGLFSDQDAIFDPTSSPVAGTYASEQGGSFTVLANGTYSYTPNGTYAGPDRVFVPFSVGTGRALERPFEFTSPGSATSGALSSGLAPVRDVVSISAALANGDPLPAWLTFNGTSFSGTPGLSDAGPLALNITATDQSGKQAVTPFDLRVGTTNSAPVAATLGGMTAKQGRAFSYTLPTGSFTDPDARDRLTYTVSLANGDPLPSWLSFDGTALTGTPDNSDVGSLSLRFRATDIFGASISSTSSLTIVNANDRPVIGSAIGNQLATQGQAFTFAVPGSSFADPDIGDSISLSASLDTGEALPTWLTFANGVFSGTPADADTGLFRIRVTATDAQGLSVKQEFVLGVVDTNDAPVVAGTLSALQAPVDTSTVFRIPSSLFADADDPSFRISVSMADGSALPNWIAYDADADTITFSPSSSYLYGKDEASTSFALRITATDSRGLSVSTNLSASVIAPTVFSTITGSGSNSITGTFSSERIDSGPGNNTITGGGGVDRIVFGRGSGQDTLNRGNDSALYPLGDIVEFGPNVTLSDLTFSRIDDIGGGNISGKNLRIAINGTADQLWINKQFSGRLDEEPTVREFVFTDGTRLSAAQVMAMFAVQTAGNDLIRGGNQPDVLSGGAGNDTILGFDGNDTIDGGSGNDTLIGDQRPDAGYSGINGGSDTFLFSRGSGNDLVFADDLSGGTLVNGIFPPTSGVDTLRFGPNITPADLIVTHLPGYPDEVRSLEGQDAGSLLIQIAGTTDSIKIDHQFYLRHFDQGAANTPGIERFEFADGTVMNRAQFESLITLAPTTSGNDLIAGGAGADRLVGGQGDDTLVGEDGADTYVYNVGDGNDRIMETMQIGRATPASSPTPRAGDIISTDSISFGAGISPDEIVFNRPDADGENLVITFRNHTGSITIEGQFRNILHGGDVLGPLNVTSYYGVENAAIDEFRFADGTKWSLSDIYAYSVRATAGADVIDGFFRPSETLDGGAGNDLLVGRNGDDTYVFARGYGNDTIKEVASFYSDGTTSGQLYTPNDRIRFVGIASTDVTTSIGAGGSFIFRINDTGETLTIRPESEFGNFKSIIFSDTTWTAAQFQSRWTVAASTAGDDQIYGFVGNDTISGGDGNDMLQGGQNSGTPQTGLGFDTLNGGLGNDTLILESSDNDRANGDDGDDTFRIAMTLPYWVSSLSTVSPARGALSYPDSVVAFGTERGVIDGGLGTDTLVLGGKIADYWQGSNYLTNNGDGSYSFKGGLRVSNVENVQFADANLSFSSLATAISQYRPNVIEGTSGNDVLNGTASNNAIYGLAGNDTLNGLDGDDFLIGGAGTDTYSGGAGTDIVDFSYDTVGWAINLTTGQAVQSTTTETLTGIEGAYGSSVADTLTGSANGDILAGFGGDDTITANGGNDFIEFDGNLGGYDAVDGGTGTDTIRAMSQNTVIGLASLAGIESITANGYAGVTIQASSSGNTIDLSAVTLTGIGLIDGAAGNDTIVGSSANDTIAGGAGDDILNGGAGDDQFFVSGTTDGFDAITGGSGTDIILATSSNARIGLTSLSQIETISSGNNSGVFVSGSANADSLDFSNVSLVGISRIDGGSGNDTLIGSAGDDVILGSAGDDSLAGGAGNDIFQYTGTSNGFDAVSGGTGTNSISALANSTIIGLTAISGIQAISGGAFTGVSIAGSAVVDILDFTGIVLTAITKIDGGAGNDTITGSNGNDTILGSGGDDVLNGGAGDDVFQFTGSANGADVIAGGDGNDTIAALAANSVIGLSSVSGVETITAGGFSGVTIAGSSLSDTLSFAAITLTGIVSINGGVGDDVITGSSSADVMLGGTENDTLSGGAGDDTLNGGAGTNILDGGLGTDVAQYSGTAGSYSVSDNGNGTFALTGAGVNDTLSSIENLNFSDGTFTLASRVGLGLSFTGTASAETLTGGGGNDTFTGLGGDDTLLGNGGNDTFRVTGTADGFDIVDGGAGSDTITATVANATIGLTSLTGVEAITSGGFAGVSIVGSSVANTLDFSAVTLTGITRIDGGAGNDVINGSSAADTIVGSAGDDTLNGGDGNDAFQYTGTANGFDSVSGGLGTDTITALANSSVIGLTSIAGVEAVSAGSFTGVSIAGSANNDVLNFTGVTLTAITLIDGGAGNDTITGSSGADTIRGSAGDDALSGGDGNDTFQYTGTTNGFDAVNGGLGTDSISALASSTVIGLTSISGVETITAGSFTGVSITGSANGDTLDFSSTTLTAITRIDGGAGNDTIVGSLAADTLLGSGGDDTINAGGGNDTIQYTGTANGFDAVDGGAGTDTISALANSTVIGLSALANVETISAGTFTGVYIAGSSANDILNFSAVTLTNIGRVEGGAGNDTLTGNTAANTLWGGLGNDIIDGGAGNDSLLGDDGDDTIVGGAGTDVINGGVGTDTVSYASYTANVTVNLATTTAQTVATSDSDTITNVENVIGGSGTDTLTGSTANNVIDGGSGNDRLTGGAGNDTIIGGVGTTDVAVFAGLQASYTIATNAGVVTITDNQATTDGNDGIDTVSGIERAEFKGGVQVGITSPIVLDLNGNGVSLIENRRTRVAFDWDGDGSKNQTGWIGKDDGFLMFDRDGNGTVSNGGELSFTSDKQGAKSDLDGLRVFDSNEDGIFSSDDAKFSQFKVWRDRNGNGRADSGEVLSLTEAGVASINLAGEAVNRTWGWGENMTVNTGTFTRTDGSVASFGDVALSFDVPRNTASSLFGLREMRADKLSRISAIQRAASQLSEAVAGFAPDGGTSELFEKHDWFERRDMVLASSKLL